MAQIHLLQGNIKLSSQSLELCLSHNFEVTGYSNIRICGNLTIQSKIQSINVVNCIL